MVHRVFGREGDVITEPRAQVVFTAHALVIIGTVVVSPLIADLAGVFDVTEVESGLFIIVFSASVTLTLPAAGVLADRIGYKATVVPGLLVFGIAGASIALVDTFEAALALRAIQGVGLACAKPILVALLGALYTGAREATAQGIRVALDSLVSIAIPVLAGALFVISWRVPFLLFVLTIPAAAWAWTSLPTVHTTSTQPLSGYTRSLLTHLTDRVIGLLLASFFFRHGMIFAMYTYISVLATRQAGLAVVMVGVLLGVRSLAKLVSSTQAGRLVGRIDPALAAVLGFVVSGAGLVMMGIHPVPIVLLGGMVVFGFGDGVLSPVQKTLLNQLCHPEYRSGAMSAAFTFQNIGQTIGPVLLGIALGILGPAPGFVLLGLAGGGIGAALLLMIWHLTP